MRTIKYKQIEDGKEDIYITGEHEDLPIGQVRLDRKYQWKMTPYFVFPTYVVERVAEKYDSSIKAGREMVKLYDHCQELLSQDSDEEQIEFFKFLNGEGI